MTPRKRSLALTTATLALGAGLALGPTAAQAAPAASPAVTTTQNPVTSVADHDVSAQGWSFYRAYWTKGACKAEGKTGKSNGWWRAYYCDRRQGNDGRMKWFLFVLDRTHGIASANA
ncbi:hypothetical protein [Streptomyces sp. NPDC059063]|uniref:hypothetical protein n=1 Tax=unclassified Streptomyces TaxID=2593676 RepID=UPI00369F8828